MVEMRILGPVISVLWQMKGTVHSLHIVRNVGWQVVYIHGEEFVQIPAFSSFYGILHFPCMLFLCHFTMSSVLPCLFPHSHLRVGHILNVITAIGG